MAALVPPPRPHRHRYYGVLAPNSPLRPAVTARAPDPVATEPASKPTVEAAADDPPPPAIGRSPARDLWAMLLARVYEAFPLTCPIGGAAMRILAFITEVVDVQAILQHIGAPTTPPRIALAREPPEWYEDAGDVPAGDDDGATPGDPLAQPEPEYEFDQRVSWCSGPDGRRGRSLPTAGKLPGAIGLLSPLPALLPPSDPEQPPGPVFLVGANASAWPLTG